MYLNVRNTLYAGGAAEHGSRTPLGRKKALLVNREEYLECAQIRKERCPLFADTRINIDDAGARLPATGVPSGIEQGAVHMDSVQYFAPTLSGPATEGTPFRAQAADGEEAEDVDGDDGVDRCSPALCPAVSRGLP